MSRPVPAGKSDGRSAVSSTVTVVRIRLVALIVAVAIAAAACGSSSSQGPSAAAGDAEPFDGEFATLGGGTVDLADFEGQDVVLWFWAPW